MFLKNKKVFKENEIDSNETRLLRKRKKKSKIICKNGNFIINHLHQPDMQHACEQKHQVQVLRTTKSTNEKRGNRCAFCLLSSTTFFWLETKQK